MLRGCSRISVRRVHDDDASRSSSWHVNIVDPDTGPSDDAQFSGRVHHGGSDFRFAAHHQALAIGQRCAQCVGPEPGLFVNYEAGVAQWLQALVAYVIGNKNFGLVSRFSLRHSRVVWIIRFLCVKRCYGNSLSNLRRVVARI